MKVARQISVYESLRNKALWRLLAADNAPIILALLRAHLLDADRRIPQSILHERIERDLEELRLLNEAQRAALTLKDVVGLAEKLEYELPLTSCRIRSLSQMTLHDPSLGLSDASISDAPPAEISLDTIGELVAQSEIDFRTVKSNIRGRVRYW